MQERHLLRVCGVPSQHRLHCEDRRLKRQSGVQKEGVIDRRPWPRVRAQILIADLNQHQRGRLGMPGRVDGKPAGEGSLH